MKKIFLILALTALMSIGANASVEINAKQNNDAQQQEGSTTTATAAPQSSTDISLFTDREHLSESNNKLADSFMAAFGMEVEVVDAGGSGDAGPGKGKAAKSRAAISRGKMGAAMSNISSTVINQVAPPFTPYSYQK